MNNSKIKLCFAVSSITNNGVTRVLSILLDEIDYSKFDVSVLLTKRTKHTRELNPSAKIIEAQKSEYNGIIGKFKTILSIHNILKNEKFDKLIALGNYASMYILLGDLGINTFKIISERNDPNNEPGKKIYRKLRDIIYKNAKIMVCQTHDASDYYKNIVEKRIIIFNPLTSELPIYNGVRNHKIINFCRIDEQKNLPLLFDAFKEFQKNHTDYEINIYGNGPLKVQMEEYVKEIGIQDCVKFYDFCQDIHEKIKDSAMFVSTSNFEGMSNSMIEAMAIGVPSICTDCPIGGAHEVIENGKNGILIPCGDKDALVEAMNKIADNPDYADRLSKESVLIRERLEKSVICEQWWKILN